MKKKKKKNKKQKKKKKKQKKKKTIYALLQKPVSIDNPLFAINN